MTVAEGLAYGALQGLTEFLPISSSAHLTLLPWFFGWQDPGLGFDVALHAGTLLAVLWYFGADWIRMLRGAAASAALGRLTANPESELFWKIAVASLPAAVVGLALEHLAEQSFRSPLLIAAALAGLGAALLWSDARPQTVTGLGGLSWRDALWIGLAQSAAIVPGVSRSGVTITAARMLDLDRETAARFSFLLATPVIGGAALLKADSLARAFADPAGLAALAASTLFGLAAIGGLLRHVRARSYLPFVVYRFALAALVVAVALGR